MQKSMWLLQTALFYLFTLFVALLPLPVADRLGRTLGLAIAFVLPKRRAIALDNISKALPFLAKQPLWGRRLSDAGMICRAMFANLGRSLIETCRLYHGSGSHIINSIEVRGREHFERARLRHKGVMMVSGHCGNWELLGLGLPFLLKVPGTGIARRQNNPYLNRMVEQLRIRYDSRIIYKEGSLRAIIRLMKADGFIGILTDQSVLPEEGVLIDVLGRTAWASRAPVIIARKTGAALLPVFIHREGTGHVVTIYPEYILSDDLSDAGVQSDVQALSQYVEEYVSEYPDQWYWVHRRWKRAGLPA